MSLTWFSVAPVFLLLNPVSAAEACLILVIMPSLFQFTTALLCSVHLGLFLVRQIMRSWFRCFCALWSFLGPLVPMFEFFMVLVVHSWWFLDRAHKVFDEISEVVRSLIDLFCLS
jgi:hypothetical protein